MFICAQVSYSKKKAGDGKTLVPIPRGDFRLLPRMPGTEEDIFLAAAAAGSHSSSRLTFPGKKYPSDINNALLRTEGDFREALLLPSNTFAQHAFPSFSPPIFFSVWRCHTSQWGEGGGGGDRSAQKERNTSCSSLQSGKECKPIKK